MTQGTYFMHYRNTGGSSVIRPQGGATLAIRKMDNDNLVVAMARCSTEDVFCKSRGRTIAEGRLNKFMNNDRDGVHIRIIPVDNDVLPIKDTVDLAIGEEMAELGYY